jgi:hypothetical protein
MASDLSRQVVSLCLSRETAMVQVLHRSKDLPVGMSYVMAEGPGSTLANC